MHFFIFTGLILEGLRKGGGSTWTPLWFFQRCFFQRDRVKLWFFVTLNFIIRDIFPENLIKISQNVQRICRFSSSILTGFINFLDLLTFPCYKEANDVRV